MGTIIIVLQSGQRVIVSITDKELASQMEACQCTYGIIISVGESKVYFFLNQDS